jgi:hypothetical protein
VTTATVHLTDGRTLHPINRGDLHSLLQHFTLSGQDRVGFDLVDAAGRTWGICVGDVARIEVAR